MTIRGRQLALVALAAVVLGCATPPAATEIEQRAHELLAARSVLRLQPDPGDLRPAARRIIERLHRGVGLVTAAPPVDLLGEVMLPPTIRVWRRSLGGSDSCSGRVDVIELERYVKGVLPHEWIVSWEVESLRAGAVAIRSYASSWVQKGGKYDCADLCDTTYSQVYQDDTDPKTDQAVDDTRGQLVVKDGALVFAEYSAENSDPTKDGVSDPPCAGKELFGHGRGMCQWGTQRWAQQGKDYRWMALHYYPGAALQESSAGPVDGGAWPVDVAGPVDGGLAPDLSPAMDGWREPPLPPTPGANLNQRMVGGCTLGDLSTLPALPMVVLLVLLLLAVRGRGGHSHLP